MRSQMASNGQMMASNTSDQYLWQKCMENGGLLICSAFLASLILVQITSRSFVCLSVSFLHLLSLLKKWPGTIELHHSHRGIPPSRHTRLMKRLPQMGNSPETIILKSSGMSCTASTVSAKHSHFIFQWLLSSISPVNCNYIRQQCILERNWENKRKSEQMCPHLNVLA